MGMRTGGWIRVREAGGGQGDREKDREKGEDTGTRERGQGARGDDRAMGEGIGRWGERAGGWVRGQGDG